MCTNEPLRVKGRGETLSTFFNQKLAAMHQELAEIQNSLLDCDTKLKTNQDDDTIKQKFFLLEVRSNWLVHVLNSVRSIVSWMMATDSTMAETKKWKAQFRKLSPSEQMGKYEDCLKLAQELAGVLKLD